MSRRSARAFAVCLIAALGFASGVIAPATASGRDAVPPPTGHVWAQVAAGEGHTCGVRRDHSLWCWGEGGSRLGHGDFDDRLVPTQVGTDTNWATVGVGEAHTCAVRTDHTLWCWGWNGFGQLGLGDRDPDRYIPAQVGTDIDWASVTLGYGHTCATRTDATLWCWGRNVYGELGLGDRKLRKTPTRVGSGSDWAMVDASITYHSYTCATRTDATLWCWGRNDVGQLGVGDTRLRTAPTQVGTDTNWALVSAGGGHTCATRIDATLWCWGDNYTGQLGLGDRGNRRSPAEVGSDTDWAYPNTGYFHSCATATDGSLWCWGDNLHGQLGLGGTRRHSTPARVGSDTNWGAVSTGASHTCANRTHHTLWCWGRNYWGQLGLGDRTDRQTSQARLGTRLARRGRLLAVMECPGAWLRWAGA